jgi:hypothetical protein
VVRVIARALAEGLAGTPQAALRLVRHLIAARDRPGSRGSGSNGTKNAFQPSTAAAFDPLRTFSPRRYRRNRFFTVE